MIYIECPLIGKISPYNGLAKAQEKRDSCHANMDEQLRSYGLKEANDYGVPSVALLRLNHAIHDEAKPIIYSKNTVILPVASLAAKSFENAPNTPEEGSSFIPWTQSLISLMRTLPTKKPSTTTA